MYSTKPDGGAFEDQLRGMILSNSDNGGNQLSSRAAGAGAVGGAGTAGVPPPSNMPPQPPTRSQHEGRGRGRLPPPLNDSQAVPLRAPPTGPPTGPSPKSSRKRPNQGQRRQMSAQLSIPIDPRPQPPHSARQYVSPPPYTNSYGNHQQQGSSHQRAHRPQSATLGPSYHNHTGVNTPLTGVPFPSQPRHQQSLSYHGPTSYDDPYGWRGHQFGNQGPALPFDAPSPRSARNPNGVLYNHNYGRPSQANTEELKIQTALLDSLCEEIIANAEIEPADIEEKERFRTRIEQICRDAIATYEREQNGIADFPPLSIRLKCFGSLSSGFATKASDMDLGLLSPLSSPQPDSPASPVPRILEKALLDAGLGARLLTRTRVPIIKLCEKPPEKLRLGLVEERTKWERGILPEHEGAEADEELQDDPEQTPTFDESPLDEAGRIHSREKSEAGEETDSERYKRQLDRLRQPENQQLPNYYVVAKRLLRKLGGRDITLSTAADFKQEDFKVLTDVSHAFVRGLADEKLKSRLLSSFSLNCPSTSSLPNFRSLSGVYTQIEGERLAMLWDEREVHEKDANQAREAQNRIRHWKEVQNKSSFGLDPIAYNKELQLVAEQLKRIPSIQVMCLAQGQFEPPAQYHSRAIKLLLDLGGHDTPSAENKLLSVMIRQYVAGIWNEELRDQVAEFARSEDVHTLRAVARRHKSLQLAVEFERALGKGFYEESCTEDILAYAALLRGPLKKTGQQHFDYVVPNTEQTASLISRIRQLRDPSKLAPNQPRDRYQDRLEFPKSGVGVQCDINFSAHLALHNTLLLRCYSHTDPRVRPLVLFVKHWAKVRGINSPYRGTLSSYGYVLMVLHYLVNIAQPFVCPNLQQLVRPAPAGLSTDEADETVVCKGKNVQFWRDEEEIKALASQGCLNQNQDPIGHLLRGFFEYYAQSNFMSTVPCRGFDWGRDVLSLRTLGGLRSKQDKGWTGARTVLQVQRTSTPSEVDGVPAVPEPNGLPQGQASDVKAAGKGSAPLKGSAAAASGNSASASAGAGSGSGVEMKEVRHRYLFAIEDPFELDHNVARTVTHNGIVSIRDEFRRAWRIIKTAGKGPQENLLDDVTTSNDQERHLLSDLLDEIHGRGLSVE